MSEKISLTEEDKSRLVGSALTTAQFVKDCLDVYGEHMSPEMRQWIIDGTGRFLDTMITVIEDKEGT